MGDGMRRGVTAEAPTFMDSSDAIRSTDRTLPCFFSGDTGSVDRVGDGTVATTGKTDGGDTGCTTDTFNNEAFETSVVLRERGPSCRRKPTVEP